MANKALTPELDHCIQLGLAPIPLKPRSKEPLVKWGNDWSPVPQDLELWAARGDPFVQARQQPILMQPEVTHVSVTCCSIRCSYDVQMMVKTLVILFRRSGCGPPPP